MEKLHDVRVLCFLIILVPITFQFVKSETFFIVTSSESPNCFESGSNESSLGSGYPENIDGSFSGKELPCLTLQQFMERLTNNSYQNLTNITLELDSGKHSLDSILSIFNITAFTMSSGTAAAIVICSQPGSVRLQVTSIEDVLISGITFVGCKEIDISFVNQFRFETSSFQSSPKFNGSLILNHTMNATITGSSFTELSQRQCNRAAMTINNSSVLVQYCTFSNSDSAIYSTHSTLAIDSCSFVNNFVMDCNQEHYRFTAMIMIISLPQIRITITNSDFIDNSVGTSPYAGIPCIHIDGSTSLVQNNTFVNNKDFDNLLIIFTEYNEIIIDHNYVYNNKIYSAVTYIDSSNVSITISNNNFTHNFATILLLHVSDSTVAINDSYFYGNLGTPWYVSGAVAIGPSRYNHLGCTSNVSVMIARCTFFHPETAGYTNGAAVSICVDTGPVSVLQCTFINRWSYVRKYASALTIDTNSSVMIGSSTFIENMVFRGVVKIRHASSILINHTSFLNNTKGWLGDGTLSMDVDNAVIVINESYFYGNLDAVFLVGKYNTFVIDKSSFINNVVDAYLKYGGMVNVSGSQTGNVVILRSNFTNNTQLYLYSTEGLYGGLHLSTNTVKIADSTFFNNSGKQCAALLMEAQDIHISNSYFQCNSAMNYSGGAICIHKGLNQMLISNSTFSHNYAKKDGGVLKMMTYDGYATINVRRSNFDNNRAGLQGGVFWTFPLDYGSFYVSDSSFINNQAGSDGGVMAMNIDNSYYSKGYSQLVITGSTFDLNRAKLRGGVFSSFIPYTYVVENSSFTSNQAGTDGGVMYVGSSKSLVRISDGSTFDFNNATGRGGVISINESRLEISNTTVFSDNLAVIGDDIIACNCDIKSTTAFIQHSYTDPSFPNCTIYGQYQVTTTDSHPTTNSLKPTSKYVVAMAVSIPLGFIVIVTVLTATVLACLCFRRQCLQKQYGVRRSAHHPDFVPLMNDAFT